MSNNEIIIKIDGKTEDIDAQPFINALNYSLEILQELDSAISMKRRGTLRWVIGILSRQSPAMVSVKSIPKSDTRDYSIDVINSYLNGLEQLKKGNTLPDNFTDDALNATKQLARISQNNIRSIEIMHQDRVVVVSEHIAVTIDELIGKSYSSTGSIEGILEMVTLHENTYFRVYDAIHGWGIPCYFDRKILPSIQKGLGQRVISSGTIRSNKNGKPESMNVTNLRLFPQESELPKPSEIRGLVKGMTDSQLAEDYLGELHR